MPLAPTRHPEDDAVVLAEVAVHLDEIDRRKIRSAPELTTAWQEIRSCDDAVIDVLDAEHRAAYQSLCTPGRAQRRGRLGPSLFGFNGDLARLHVGIHRRLLFISDL